MSEIGRRRSALIERNEPDPGSCIRVLDRREPTFEFAWHKHDGYELTLITGSSGRRFVGDHVAEYAPGDLVLIGPMLPHTWVSEGGEAGSALVVQFGSALLGAWPEATAVAGLLEQAAAGVRFTGRGVPGTIRRIEALAGATALQRIVRLLDVLDRLSAIEGLSREVLARPDSALTVDPIDPRLARVLSHVSSRFRDPLTQRECAHLVGMTPSGFCRLFKRSMHRTFTQHVNDLRTSEACRLLAAGEQRVTSIAFEAGFDNLSYFNRVFRRAKGMSPTAYRAAWAGGFPDPGTEVRRSA